MERCLFVEPYLATDIVPKLSLASPISISQQQLTRTEPTQSSNCNRGSYCTTCGLLPISLC
ncbi:hypothetical protein B7P43_G14978 [Cryptotermes secundus]|uniref:Uncharacterized protein n=1 Tax=Cryptotermes secundus TaxID=105785 RepID=A0A2J7RJB6_9NEOP|nr:hypothetical protein B7P43_G14978 [Cryptotermes secundus]